MSRDLKMAAEEVKSDSHCFLLIIWRLPYQVSIIAADYSSYSFLFPVARIATEDNDNNILSDFYQIHSKVRLKY